MALKLSYFQTRGLGEPIRLLLADKQVPFEDHRLSRDEWPEYKPKMIFGQVPCLISGDEELVQSAAILRHLGRLHGLNGSNETETKFIDMFYEGIRDLHNKYVAMIYQNYENGKEPYIKNTLPEELARLEKLFHTYKNGEQYVAGSAESYADYVLFEELDIHLILSPTCLDGTPALKKFHERFAERPNIKSYLNKRAAINPAVNGNGKQ
uniref:Glutathione S-transferase n=1 Tax=Caenorhabditis japonica TaxID=281687 RepID=A0A8R1I1W8_CAEJA